MTNDIAGLVQDKYAAVAKAGLSTDHEGVRAVAEAFGYTAEQLASIPAEANMGLSCGNPTAFASLKPGEVVVDLGCGGGLDVFLAAEGRADGQGHRHRHDARNARLGPPERRQGRRRQARSRTSSSTRPRSTSCRLPDASVDCVISNCVINLAPDKRAVFREIVRVLKPGGRLAVSDIALKKPLPPELGNDLMAYVGCIAGAIAIDDYRSGLDRSRLCPSGHRRHRQRPERLRQGGKPVRLLFPGNGDLRCRWSRQSSCCSSASSSDADLHRRLADLLRRYNVNDYAASVRVFAVKPVK